MGWSRFILAGALAAVAAAGCNKVPLVDINARFALADVTWFEEEQTLFVFYRVEADQGLQTDVQVELHWRTDDEEQPWAPVAQLQTVHTHVPVDCGRKQLCGSTSVRLAKVPRQVGLRLRYHPLGEVTLDAPVAFNVVAPGPPYTHRSLLVYGVFDGSNTRVQWRARHRFPTLRNHQVQELGLRRHFAIHEPAHGEVQLPEENLYGYGHAPTCPSWLSPLGSWPIQTTERAVFDDGALPLDASTSKALCARSVVTDAQGEFEAVAVARKNPETRPAFPFLRSPVRDNTAIGFVLRPCGRVISEPHLAMQVQRLLLAGAQEICTDDWSAPGFADQLAGTFRSSIDLVRFLGEDMVLVMALHRDDQSPQLVALVEQALATVLPSERDKSSPRVSGAFVFDSRAHTIGNAELRQLVLWCPANLSLDDLDLIPGAAERSCPLLPDMPDLALGPVRLSTLPILPTRRQYLTFIDKYSEGQAGRMKSLLFRAPERTPTSDNVLVGEYGVATFFNGEVLTAGPEDAFSYCTPDEGGFNPVVFRIPQTPEPMPLSTLPELHRAFPQDTYALGLFWDFPFLLRLQYDVFLAGAATAYSFTVPFGVASPQQEYYGAATWHQEEFPVGQWLLQCTRFCDHPTFDSAGVYNVASLFRETYASNCYRPRYPVPGDGGFPLDP